ncbi:MAG TPA: hypothetical protein ENK43_12340 [Planctomycetes bacterium]|nr:hypothetical protein [Planctomycetota bacterium]
MSEPGRTRIVVVDANVLINLIHVDRLDLCGSLENIEFVVPEEVVAEVTDPDQAVKLVNAFDMGHLRREASSDPAEIEAYAELWRVMGKGEAACLAIAHARGWMVASDERGRFLRHVRERLGEGRVLNTPGLLVLAIRTGLLTIEQADQLKLTLENHRFKMRFASFRDVLEEL